MRGGTDAWLQVGLVALGLLTSAPATSWAQSRAEREYARLAAALAAPTTQTTAEQTLAAIDGLAALGSAEGAARLAAHLHEGQPDPITDRVVAALGAHPSRAALPLLVELANHRRTGVRVGAYAALAKIEGSDVTTLLAEGLRDGHAEVRGTAARLLGERGDRAAVDALFLAFERGVPEAAEAIGRLAPATDLARFGAYLERRALHLMLGGYTRFMERADIDEASKLGVVATLEQVSGPLVKQWLRAQLAAQSAAQTTAQSAAQTTAQSAAQTTAQSAAQTTAQSAAQTTARSAPAEQRLRFAIAASLARVVERPEPAATPVSPEPSAVPVAKEPAPP